MVYIYENEGRIVYQRNTRPEADRVIELDRMIPEPVQDGCDSILCADFETGRVWFELIENIYGARARKLARIEAYDHGPEVNRFWIGDKPMWRDKETRGSLARSIGIEAEAGQPTTTIWDDEATPPVCYELPVADALQMLSALEMYAVACFNVTQAHKAAVYALETREEVEAYDHTTDYPEQLTFNL